MFGYAPSKNEHLHSRLLTYVTFEFEKSTFEHFFSFLRLWESSSLLSVCLGFNFFPFFSFFWRAEQWNKQTKSQRKIPCIWIIVSWLIRPGSWAHFDSRHKFGCFLGWDWAWRRLREKPWTSKRKPLNSPKQKI